MQISETKLEQDYTLFTDDELLRLGVIRQIFYVKTQSSADEIISRLAEFKTALGAS